jgi:hypothetical protein
MKPVPYSPLAVPGQVLSYPVILESENHYCIGYRDAAWIFPPFIGTPKEIARKIFIRCTEYKFYYEPARKIGNFSIMPFVINFNGKTDLYFVQGAITHGLDIDSLRAQLIEELDKFRHLLWFW